MSEVGPRGVCTTTQSYTHVQYMPVSHSPTLVKDGNQVRGFTCNISSIAPLVAYSEMIPGIKLRRIPNHCSHYACLSLLGMIDR
ncbi:hypothetical protein QWA68_008105 [Fusarium oxysporum]|nr:hypothetical protein QWA68_008105 [Fusarium oxysporum]